MTNEQRILSELAEVKAMLARLLSEQPQAELGIQQELDLARLQGRSLKEYIKERNKR